MRLILLTVPLLLAGCAKDVVISSVDVPGTSHSAKFPGKYAAIVQSGTWTLNFSSSGNTCLAYHFTAHLDTAYEEAAKRILTQEFDTVEFVKAPLTPAQLSAQGYTGQLTIGQGPLSGRVTAKSPNIQAAVTLQVTVAFVDARRGGNNKSFSDSLSGSSISSDHSVLFFCDSIGDVMADAFRKALSEAIRNAERELSAHFS